MKKETKSEIKNTTGRPRDTFEQKVDLRRILTIVVAVELDEKPIFVQHHGGSQKLYLETHSKSVSPGAR